MRTDEFVNMTGPEIFDLADDIEGRCRAVARGWERGPVEWPDLIDADLARRKAGRWNAFADVFKEARTKVFMIIGDEIGDESCGA